MEKDDGDSSDAEVSDFHGPKIGRSVPKSMLTQTEPIKYEEQKDAEQCEAAVQVANPVGMDDDKDSRMLLEVRK